MKRKIVLLLMALGVFALCSCDNSKEVSETYSFKAVIIEADDGALTVKPDPDSDAAKSSDKIVASLKDAEYSFAPKAGDTVEIFYEGGIMETYPASLEKVIKITLISETPADGEKETKTLLNPRGDMITVTAQSDGTYTDGSTYVFDGTENYIDEDGCEWSEALPED